MNGRIVITVEGLSKLYRLGAIGGRTLREDLERWWATVRGQPDPQRRFGFGPQGDVDHWALRGVSFEVREGEVLGVIGRNGAGKSTLLKILSRITAPTSGRATIHGRVGSLLEVGTGFHPELSGRENIYLNGSILGMKNAEINRKFDEIVDFAEMGRFIDTPVKRYSSGMSVRLAFAVAAHLEPEVLIIDEVLAVGDANFQKRCVGKMQEVASHGRTVLFVSHNMQSIQMLCNRCILLNNARVAFNGAPEMAVREYLSTTAGFGGAFWADADGIGDDSLRLTGMRFLSAGANGASGETLMSKDALTIELDLNIRECIAGLCIGFDLLSERGEVVLRSYQTDVAEADIIETGEGTVTLCCHIPSGTLNAGRYLVAPRIGVHNQYWIVHADPLVEADVMLSHGVSPYWGSLDRSSRPGVIAPIMKWTKN